jgi:hypothetical protein
VRALEDNLRAPLSAGAIAELARGSELAPGSTRPPRALALGSSAALVLNVFAYWREREPAPLVAALGIAERDGSPTLSFEEPLPTGLAGEPPTTDVALRWPCGRLVAIESKFGEWLVRRPRHRRVFKDKYFPPDSQVFADAGLPRCQTLAEALQRGEERCLWLNAAQILKHALGLARSGASSAALVYLYYDWRGREQAAHRAEVDRVHSALAGEVEMAALTYQELYGGLRSFPGVEADYLKYLGERYFF